jgi:hypothetical protein
LLTDPTASSLIIDIVPQDISHKKLLALSQALVEQLA